MTVLRATGSPMVRLKDLPLVAVLRAPDAGAFVAAAHVLADAGFQAVEFTLTTRGALEALQRVRHDLPDLLIGAGTIRSSDHVEAAADAGADFLVSQLTQPSVMRAAVRHGLTLIPGALTPNEIATALELGAETVKVSPICAMGGARYLTEVLGPMPEAQLFPTGGVELEEVVELLQAGAAVVGVSKALYRDALTSKEGMAGLAQRANHVVDLVRTWAQSRPGRSHV